MKKFLLSVVIGLLLAVNAFGQVPIYTRGPSSSTSSVPSTAFPLLAPDGTACTVPSYAFASSATSGIALSGGAVVGCVGGVNAFSFNSSGVLLNGKTLSFSNGGGSPMLVQDASDVLAQKDSTAAQTLRVYFSTTGPVHLGLAARTAGGVLTATGGAMQLSTVQTTVPTVTVNGGTGPACVGTDTAMGCTIGTAPPAAATFTVTFNGTWPAAPSCVSVRGTTGTTPVVTSVATTTTTAVVTLSANLVASERYNLLCMGVS